MYTLFIGFRKIGVFPTIREAKKFATESELTGVFTLWVITTEIVGINFNQ